MLCQKTVSEFVYVFVWGHLCLWKEVVISAADKQRCEKLLEKLLGEPGKQSKKSLARGKVIDLNRIWNAQLCYVYGEFRPVAKRIVWVCVFCKVA